MYICIIMHVCTYTYIMYNHIYIILGYQIWTPNSCPEKYLIYLSALFVKPTQTIQATDVMVTMANHIACWKYGMFLSDSHSHFLPGRIPAGRM